MEFVENYLRDVVFQSSPFADKEKNKLTSEVSLFDIIKKKCSRFDMLDYKHQCMLCNEPTPGSA